MKSFVLLAGALGALPVALALPRGVEYAHVLQHRDVKGEYDYVIVGGGTAGLTVADRLTEDGKTTVLVLEVGELGMVALRAKMLLSGMRCTLDANASRRSRLSES